MKKTIQTLLPLWSLTFWAIALLLVRMVLFQASYYDFLIWNVVLAWIPVILSTFLFFTIVLKKKQYANIFVGFVIFLWLLFLPNAPYLVTDFIHLRPRNGVPIWFDVMILFSYAILGLFQFEYSLIQMREVLRHVISHKWNKWFVPGVMLLMSIGVYLGRFLRWNSWEVFTNSPELVKEAVRVVTTPYQLFIAAVYTISTTVLLCLFHYLLHGVRDILDHK